MLNSLPAELRGDVVMRMANLEQISPEILSKITNILSQRIQSLGDFSRESYGGVRAVAELINRLDSSTSVAILEKIENENPNLALSIRNLMFVFDDILLIEDVGMREVIQRVDKKTLTVALKGTSEQLKNQFFRHMSHRAVEMLREDMDVLGPVKIKEVEAAQNEIVAIIRKLDQDGVISLKGGGRGGIHQLSGILQAAASGDDGIETHKKAGSDGNPAQATLLHARDRRRSVPAQAIPAWMEQVAPPKRPGGQVPSLDPAHIEKAAYENGFRQGEKAGLEIAEKKAEVLMRRYADAIEEIGRLKPALYQQAEREVVKLAVEVAKKIVHREVQVDQEIVQTLVKVALSHVAVKTAVTVHLHPTDYNFVLDQRAASNRGGENDREIVLLADKSIERGGCLIETECGDIDARIEEEFREVERAFFSIKE